MYDYVLSGSPISLNCYCSRQLKFTTEVRFYYCCPDSNPDVNILVSVLAELGMLCVFYRFHSYPEFHSPTFFMIKPIHLPFIKFHFSIINFISFKITSLFSMPHCIIYNTICSYTYTYVLT